VKVCLTSVIVLNIHLKTTISDVRVPSKMILAIRCFYVFLKVYIFPNRNDCIHIQSSKKCMQLLDLEAITFTKMYKDFFFLHKKTSLTFVFFNSGPRKIHIHIKG